MTSLRCYDNCDVIITLVITNFDLYLIQLWQLFVGSIVNDDVVYSQTWAVLPLKTRERDEREREKREKKRVRKITEHSYVFISSLHEKKLLISQP